jgi:hypothetical protein
LELGDEDGVEAVVTEPQSDVTKEKSELELDERELLRE